MLTSHINVLPTQPRKQVLKSMIGSLNASIIGYLRGHIRNSKYENSSRDGQEQTIDKFNEALAEELEHQADAKALEDMGLGVQIKPYDVAEKLEAIRAWCIEQLTDMMVSPNDVPLTISDTIKFQLSREQDINEPALKALALALNLDIEVLRVAKVKILNDDRQELLDMAGQILDLSTKLNVDVQEADDAFSSLPAQIQYKLIATLANSMKKSGDKALASLLRFNRLESAGDITMIKAAHKDVYEWLQQFTKAHMTELSEFQERGGRLAEVVALS